MGYCCFLLCLHKVNLLATTEPTMAAMEKRKHWTALAPLWLAPALEPTVWRHVETAKRLRWNAGGGDQHKRINCNMWQEVGARSLLPFCDKEGQPMNNGGTSRQARSSGDQKTVDCPPGSSINGTCVGTQCEVTCGNGKKVEMECPDEWININGSTATCGKKPACFPFCDKEGQPLKGCLPGSPGFPFC